MAVTPISCNYMNNINSANNVNFTARLDLRSMPIDKARWQKIGRLFEEKTAAFPDDVVSVYTSNKKRPITDLGTLGMRTIGTDEVQVVHIGHVWKSKSPSWKQTPRCFGSKDFAVQMNFLDELDGGYEKLMNLSDLNIVREIKKMFNIKDRWNRLLRSEYREYKKFINSVPGCTNYRKYEKLDELERDTGRMMGKVVDSTYHDSPLRHDNNVVWDVGGKGGCYPTNYMG